MTRTDSPSPREPFAEVNPNAASLDIGSAEIWACVPADRAPEDVQDCQWIQRLHSYGLLNASFRPEAEMCALRAYLRHRASLITHRAAHIQHMQKALHQMQVQLTQVLSDITGETGLRIIRAIVAGARDPVQLA